jgi:hypothetical protein
MPHKEIDYSKTIIYKIVCNDLAVTDCYVGHTTDFICRKAAHKMECNKENHKQYNYKIYQTIRANGGWDNWSMIEIEKYPCQVHNEATARERYWYETLNANMNTYVPSRTKKEYNKTNIDKYRNIKKKYIEKNNLTIDCECGGKYKHYHKNNHIKTLRHIGHLKKINSLGNV